MDNQQKEFLSRFEAYLDNDVLNNLPNKLLLDSMRYSCLSGGKRIRPLLCFAMAQVCGLTETQVLPLAASIELIHCFSLIHDDLPCMDNDDYRRGRLTNHKVYGEAVALLCGDNLQMLAIEVLSSDSLACSSETKLELIKVLTRATSKMIVGQVIDIDNTNKNISIDSLNQMHLLKTGALIECSLLLPLIANNVPHSTIILVQKLAYNLGLLFQVVDDVLDATATSEQLGKTANKDANNNKATYVTLFGLDQARTVARNLYVDSCSLCNNLDNNEIILSLIEIIYSRTN